MNFVQIINPWCRVGPKWGVELLHWDKYRIKPLEHLLDNIFETFMEASSGIVETFFFSNYEPREEGGTTIQGFSI